MIEKKKNNKQTFCKYLDVLQYQGMLEVPTLFGNTSCHGLLFSFVRKKGQDTTMTNNRADTGVGVGVGGSLLYLSWSMFDLCMKPKDGAPL